MHTSLSQRIKIAPGVVSHFLDILVGPGWVAWRRRLEDAAHLRLHDPHVNIIVRRRRNHRGKRRVVGPRRGRSQSNIIVRRSVC